MKWLVAIVAILVVAGSIYADYRWRRWIADRSRNRSDIR
jgi:hypothetical protein